MKRALLIGATAFLPAAMVLVATVHFYDARFRITTLFADKGGLLTIAALAGGLYALGLLVYVSHLRERLDLTSGDREKIRQAGDYLFEKTESMQSDIEVLSAVRNLTGILADEGQLDSILEQVTQVVRQVTDCREVAVFLIDERSGRAVPGAHRIEDDCRVGKALRKIAIDASGVAEAIEHRAIMRSLASDDMMSIAVPLAADQELLGALRLVAEITGEAEARAARIEKIESMTTNLAGHIAVAVKTTILYNRAVVDALTGLYTRRHFARQIESQFSASQRLGKPMAVILIDLNDFKAINDTHGHLFGDRILAAAGELILKSLRGYDTAYRYGGDEICVLLPEADSGAAFRVSERIRQGLARRVFLAADKKRVQVTLCAGVTEFEPGMASHHDLIRQADEALYASKRRGKNSTCIWEKALHDQLPPRPGGPAVAKDDAKDRGNEK